MVRRKASKQDKKENVSIKTMALRVRDWGIAKPQNAQNCVWTWGFKYKNPPKCTGGFQNHALCAICLVDNLGAATVKLSKDNSPTDNLPSSQLRGIDYTPHPSHCLCFFSAAFCDPPPADPPSGAPSSAAALSSTNRLFLRQTSDAWGPQWRRPWPRGLRRCRLCRGLRRRLGRRGLRDVLRRLPARHPPSCSTKQTDWLFETTKAARSTGP